MGIKPIKIDIFFLMLFFISAAVSAQPLKPKEIIYSRLPNNVNAPPTGANQPTIWAVGQDGSNDRMITTGTFPRISDDGRFLLFKRFTRHPLMFNPFGGYADFFIRELATGQETLIAQANFDQGSVGHYFSPESNQGNYEIIFDDSCLMYKMNRDGSGIAFLYPTTFPAYCGDDFPVLRRGGDQLIAFQNLTNDAAHGGLLTVNINGSIRRKIPNTACGDMNPAWSNDSQVIAYGTLFEACGSSFPQNAYPYFVLNLYKIKPDGTSKQQLTNFASNDCRQANSNCLTLGMVWTEDDSKLIAAGRVNGVKGLFAFNTDGNAGFSQIPISAGNAPDFVGGIVQPRVERNVVSAGGGITAGSQYTLVSTIGEPVAGQTSAGGMYSLASGFWAIPGENKKAPFDFDGDGKTDVGVWRASSGSWWYLHSSDLSGHGHSFGVSSDIITPGDFTGDGKADIAVFRPSNGFWYIQRSEDASYFAFPFGLNGDIPAPADYDNDGKTDAAVFRPSTATWYILNSGGSGTGILSFGLDGDRPVPADYDGDGKADIAVWRASNGSWWIVRSSDLQARGYGFGTGNDKPVPGEWTGDAKADIAVYRPSTGAWYFLRSEDESYYSVPFGLAGDIPAPGDYDGDGRFDTAVFRPSTVTWYMQGSTAGTMILTFGLNGDRPIPNAFVP